MKSRAESFQITIPSRGSPCFWSRPSHAFKILSKRSGSRRAQPPIIMGERRLYNFSLNTKKASKQSSRILEEKKASEAEHQPQQEHQQTAEKVCENVDG